MKLFIGQFNTEFFQKALEKCNLDLSLFVDILPEKQEDLSGINIIALQEPNEYFGRHTAVLQNHHLFDLILTYNDMLLNRLSNAKFLPFGATWFSPDQYQKEHPKKFQVAHLAGRLQITYGHSLRHELLARQDEIKIPKKFYHTYGERDNVELARIGKEEVFGDCQFGVCIENTSHNGYFTEKLLDCFLLKTIPIYWGCSDIHIPFDMEGVITFQNVDDAIRKINTLDDKFYENCEHSINYNYEKALQYVSWEETILKAVLEFYRTKGLINDNIC